MSGTNTIEIRNLCKTYGDLVIFDHLNLTLAPDTVYCLTGASGIGKTTLLHMLLGLEAWDSGEILGLDGLHTAAVFQEDRLCLSFSPLENIRMAVGKAVSREEILKEAEKLLPPESLSRPASTLSGGQKRRTAILRALLAQSDLIVMDEPFTGLDDGTKELAVNYVREKARGKICVIATHDMQDAEVLNARRIPL